MSVQPKSSKRAILLLGLLALVCAGGVSWWVARARAHDDPSAQLSVDSLRDMMNKDETDKLIALATSDDLSAEDRALLRRNMREVMESEMNRRVDEYFAAPEDQRVAVLDRHIDEFQQRMPKWMESMRKLRDAEREREQNANGGNSNSDGSDRRREWMREAMSKENQQQRVEGNSAERNQKRFAYFAASMARARERGIEMPRMGGGGWGGRGPGGAGQGGPRSGGSGQAGSPRS